MKTKVKPTKVRFYPNGEERSAEFDYVRYVYRGIILEGSRNDWYIDSNQYPFIYHTGIYSQFNTRKECLENIDYILNTIDYEPVYGIVIKGHLIDLRKF